MTGFDKEAQKLLDEVWTDIQNRNKARELEAIKANPEKHRLTRLMAHGANTGYTYFPAEETATTRIRYCVSTHRNAAGVYLIWRQIERFTGKGRKRKWRETERVEWAWAPTKKEAFVIARKRARKSRDGYAARMAAKLPDAPQEARDMLDQALTKP